MNLTEDQIKAVAEKKRQSAARPLWYNASTRLWDHISSEMESFVILLNDSQRTALLTMLQTSIAPTNPSADAWTEALREYLDYDLTDLSDRYNKLAIDLSYSDTDVMTLYSNMNSTEDLVAFGNDLKYGSDVLPREMDDLFYRKTTNQMFSKVMGQQRTEDEKTQVQSWIEVLIEYV